MSEPSSVSPARLIRSAAAAYRADLGERVAAFGDKDSAWLAVASLLEHSALNPPPQRAVLLGEAVAMSNLVLTRRAIRRFADRDWGDGSGYHAIALVLMAEEILQAGAAKLAQTVLDALLTADASLTPIERGRVVARRARADWMAGNLDEALVGYRAVARVARETGSVELKVRSLIGRMAVAQMKGNYPQIRVHALRVVRLASDAGLDRLRREGHNGVMIAASMRRQFDEALRHAWAVYELSAGDAIDEGETLQNIGQVLLLAGHPATARAAFAALLARGLPARIAMPALGGLALAGAATGDSRTVEWATREVKRAASSQVPRYAVASALLECASACAAIGDVNSSAACRSLAAQIAAEHKFHEITYRAEEMVVENRQPTKVAPHSFAPKAARIAEDVQWLEPKRLPKHVDLEAALA